MIILTQHPVFMITFSKRQISAGPTDALDICHVEPGRFMSRAAFEVSTASDQSFHL